MAHGNGNFLLKGIRGNLGKQLVIKQYGTRMVISMYPRMPKKKNTELQQLYEDRFKDAIKYAQSIIYNWDLKKKYAARLKPGQRVFNQAIKEYMALVKAGKLPPKLL